MSADVEGTTIASPPASPLENRSRSRGRDFTSSGRGGAGNIRAASQSRPRDGPDDFSPTRGRDVAPPPRLIAPNGGPTVSFTHSGRGGAGNIRSPSRGPVPPEVARAEKETIHAAAERDAEMPHSSGRGGFGNIVSKSRSRSREPGVHSSGRGGVGNMYPQAGAVGADGTILEEEAERRAYHQPEGVHSTGRGGLANISAGPAPHVEATAAVYQGGAGVHSSGRGGAGNIREASRTRSATRTTGKKEE